LRQAQKKEMAVNKFAVAATLALMLGGQVHAGVIELDAAPAPPEGVAVLQSDSSDLAEPAVLAMMLLGLCLIGYRARRDSGEPFK
jgi:hypothetical protein